MSDSELLTVSQVAEACNATNQTIRNWIKNGRLNGVRIGNRFLIPREELDRVRETSGSTGERVRGIAALMSRSLLFHVKRRSSSVTPTRAKAC